jgi:hypothetical protein
MRNVARPVLTSLIRHRCARSGFDNPELGPGSGVPAARLIAGLLGSSARKLVRLSSILYILTMLEGCSPLSNPTDNPFTVQANANGKPTVWDCSVTFMASPPRYACSDNKTYTAFQLRDARLGTDTPLASK